MQASAFLKNPAGSNLGPMVALFGAEHWFKREALAAVVDLVLGKDRDAEEGPRKFRGKDVDFATVQDALLTVSMWSPRQVIVVEEADDFVSDHRAALEKYLDRPAKKSVLVLEVKTWPATTRLAKRVAEIACRSIALLPKGPSYRVGWSSGHRRGTARRSPARRRRLWCSWPGPNWGCSTRNWRSSPRSPEIGRRSTKTRSRNWWVVGGRKPPGRWSTPFETGNPAPVWSCWKDCFAPASPR